MTQAILRDESYKAMNPAQRTAYNKNPNGGTIRSVDLRGHDPKHYSACLPCLLKALTKDYWSNQLVNSTEPHRLQPFPYSHDPVFKLHQLLQRYFCHDPDGHTDDMNDLRSRVPSVTQATIDRRTRAARRMNMTAQQDADELTRRIWDGIEASFDSE
jgi:hypothetical protein